MIGEGIHEEVLRALVEQHAVRECLVTRIDGGSDWGLSIRLDGSGARWVPVRSRRERLRTWASLTAVGRFADSIGLKGFTVEL
ncbi:hypothetical protein CXF97_11015 [Pseudomonas sp. Choline-02u-1]|jgi:hypothetical protein|uniref:hypothetical protein n=1 Tax=unclassified Pseudomonas TaxID=196821 RepID=UPI000C32666C|nr:MULTISPECIES: hypothetical protein [unclassified Pseudomonas]MCW0920329.1 hypothetical protein [Pseudomonas sp. RG1]PKH82549.1 hypothetical protein CXF97_11015 [Pseudomonas sp. Choline-02u-1]